MRCHVADLQSNRFSAQHPAPPSRSPSNSGRLSVDELALRDVGVGPLHQQAPHKCSHDHTISAATLTRAIVDAQRPLVAAIVIAAPDATLEPLALDRSRIEHLHLPPLRSPRIDVLRI